MHQILNESKWLKYRLADIVRGMFWRKEKWDYLARIEKKLPESVAGQYLKRTKGLKLKERCNNYEILESIIAET
jgi:hypothetical protein